MKNNLDVSFQTSKLSDRLREQKIEPYSWLKLKSYYDRFFAKIGWSEAQNLNNKNQSCTTLFCYKAWEKYLLCSTVLVHRNIFTAPQLNNYLGHTVGPLWTKLSLLTQKKKPTKLVLMFFGIKINILTFCHFLKTLIYSSWLTECFHFLPGLGFRFTVHLTLLSNIFIECETPTCPVLMLQRTICPMPAI